MWISIPTTCGKQHSNMESWNSNACNTHASEQCQGIIRDTTEVQLSTLLSRSNKQFHYTCRQIGQSPNFHHIQGMYGGWEESMFIRHIS
jgi:hypothetical protein